MVTITAAVRAPTSYDYTVGSRSEFTLGVDLGQSIDPTAIALVERLVETTGKTEWIAGNLQGAMNPRAELAVSYRCRAVELLPLGTKYQAITEHLARRFDYVSGLGKTELVFDETGARAAGDMIRAAIRNAIGATLTGSERDARIDSQRWSVSKANMVSGLLAGIENGDLELADDLTDIDTLKAHLTDLRRKISALGHLSFNAREGSHDDYVTALGLAYWWLTRPKHYAHMGKLADF